jgi:DNA-directed RNA polymerase specialized sigma24 family protein
MALYSVSSRLRQTKDRKSQFDELGYALHHCWDLPALQASNLTRLPSVAQQALEETNGLGLAKALRKELIVCAEQITQRPRYPIEEIISAIEKERLGLSSQDLLKIQKAVGVPFPRHQIDLARYYTIRLVMQGVDHQTIADFLDVDPRTVANYVAQAKERIRLTLDSKSMFV